MSALHVDIESLAIEGFEGGEDGARALLQAALAALAAKLRKSPLAGPGLSSKQNPGSEGSRRLALAELELGELSAEQLRGPAGASALAEALYVALQRSVR